mgnify:CR=1 FL=1
MEFWGHTLWYRSKVLILFQGKGFLLGASRPPDIIVFNPCSTVIPVEIVSAWGIIKKNPDVGLGVVGTKRWK